MVFFGYEPGSKAYRVYNPRMKKLHVSRDTIFEEDKEWQWELAHRTTTTDQRHDSSFTVHFDQEQEGEQSPPRTPMQMPAADEHTPATTPLSTPYAEVSSEAQGSIEQLAGAANSPGSDMFDNSPKFFRSLQDIYDATRDTDEELGLCFLSVDEPTSHVEAAGNESWRIAMLEELTTIRRNNTWEFTKLPKGHRATV